MDEQRMTDQQISDILHTYYKPWRDLVNLCHAHGLPLNTTHQQTLEWLRQRLILARDIETALQEYQELNKRITALEEREFGK